ncbi:hypothetical protein ACF0H5_019463 [Mactra antiquata]
MLKELTLPSPDWGPRLDENKTGKYSTDVYVTPTDITETTISPRSENSIQLEMNPSAPQVDNSIFIETERT